MKRNYVALLLGLALTVSSISVYASEGATEAATETTTEATTETANAAVSTDAGEDAELIIGQVTKVSADSITITKGVLSADDQSATDTEDTETTEEAATEAASEDATEAGTEASTEAASGDTENAEAVQGPFTLTLTNESLTYDFAEDAKFQELAQTEDIEVKAADDTSSEAASEDTTEAATEAATEAVSEAASEDTTEAATEAASEDTTEAVSEAASEDTTETTSEDGTISISADGIMEGDVVSIQLNSDGTVASVTILAYGTGSVVGGADEATEISLDSTEVSLSEEAATEAATEAVTE